MSNNNNDNIWGGDKSVEIVQQEVNELSEQMRVNVQKVLERDAQLNDLNQQATQLEANAMDFGETAHTVQRKMWWKNVKMWIIIVIVVIVIIIIIAVWVSVANSNSSSPPTTIALI